jgi:integrase/recombinase XerD
MKAPARAQPPTSSQAHKLTSFRQFFRYLLREGMIAEDPTARIAMPKIGRSLPQWLSEEEVELLLAAPDASGTFSSGKCSRIRSHCASSNRITQRILLPMCYLIDFEIGSN